MRDCSGSRPERSESREESVDHEPRVARTRPDVTRKKILLLGATFNTDNMGVGALTSGALRALARDADADAVFLDYGVEPTVSECTIAGRTLRVPLINLRFSWKPLPNNVAYLLLLSLAVKPMHPRWRQRVVDANPWLKAIDQAHAAVAVSGGDSFSDIYGMERFFYVVLPQLLVLMLGKDLVLFPQTIGPFRRAFARRMATFVMRRAKAVYSRDEEGRCEAVRLLRVPPDDRKVRFCYDLGFLCEPQEPATRSWAPEAHAMHGRALPVVGLNVSGLLLMGGYGRDNTFALKTPYRALVERVVGALVHSMRAHVVLIPHVFGTQAESDTVGMLDVFQNLRTTYGDRITCITGTYDQSEIKYIIGTCDFFIGSRMHACIAALSQCVPAIGIAYSRKFAGVFRSIDVERLVADPREMTVDEVLDVIARAFDERHLIRAGLQERMPAVRRTVLALSQELA